MKFPATRDELKKNGYTFVYARPCRRCDRPLEFYRSREGRTLPLECTVIGRIWVMDSHFKTCSYANEFSKTSAAKETKQGDLFGPNK